MDDLINERLQEKAKRRRSRFLSWFYKCRRPCESRRYKLPEKGYMRRVQHELNRIMNEVYSDE